MSGIAFNNFAYNGGELRRSGDQWADYRNDSDAVHLYKLLSQSQSEVFLYSESSRRLYRIDIGDEKLYMASSGGPLNSYANITAMSGVSANPPVVEPPTPVRPGTMSFEEREECIWSGGRVERAGLAGFERCTRPYSHGGKSCADSSECQGQCRVPSDYANQSNIRGVCQMDDNPFGCFAEVKNGRTEFALCAD